MIETKILAGELFVVVEKDGKKRTVPIETAIEEAFLAANEAKLAAESAESDAETMSKTLDGLILAGTPTGDIRATLDDIRERHQSASEARAERLRAASVLIGLVASHKAGLLAAQADTEIQAAVDAHPVPEIVVDAPVELDQVELPDTDASVEPVTEGEPA